MSRQSPAVAGRFAVTTYDPGVSMVIHVASGVCAAAPRTDIPHVNSVATTTTMYILLFMMCPLPPGLPMKCVDSAIRFYVACYFLENQRGCVSVKRALRGLVRKI